MTVEIASIIVPAVDHDGGVLAGGQEKLRPEIGLRSLVFYALPSLPIAFLSLPVSLLLPTYYASTMGISLSAIGGFLLASRLADVVLDPMIGKWSDQTHSRFGRRKLWMWIGTPILMLGAALLFMPAVRPNGWYLLIASFVIYAGGSTVGLPYSAWGTEIVPSYHGRARLAGIREAAGVVGGLLAAVIPTITGAQGHGIDRFTMGIMGWVIIISTPLAVLAATWLVPETPTTLKPRVDWMSSLSGLISNKPFRLFCLTFVVMSIGSSVAGVTMVFYINAYLKAPTMVGISLLVLAITTVAAVPLWLKISHRIGKHRATALSIFLSMLLYGGVSPFLRPGDGLYYSVLLAFLGVASSGLSTLPLGIIGDVIDYDTLMKRQARGGIYWGVWSFAQKFAPALGIGVTLPLLTLFGFSANGHNTVSSLQSLKYIYCFGPVPFYTIAGVLFFLFPIDAKRHAVIVRGLVRLEKRAAAVTP
jgi:GPH family glycoside/pentoside/hexuronide:cation symporter